MFPASARFLAIEERRALDQQCINVVRGLSWIFGINNNDVRTPRGNQDEVRMRNFVSFSACNANLVRHERYGVIEFANGIDDHRSKIVSPGGNQDTLP